MRDCRIAARQVACCCPFPCFTLLFCCSFFASSTRPPSQCASRIHRSQRGPASASVLTDQFCFDWYGGLASETRARRSPESGYYTEPLFEAFHARIAVHSPSNPERLVDPY